MRCAISVLRKRKCFYLKEANSVIQNFPILLLIALLTIYTFSYLGFGTGLHIVVPIAMHTKRVNE